MGLFSHIQYLTKPPFHRFVNFYPRNVYILFKLIGVLQKKLGALPECAWFGPQRPFFKMAAIISIFKYFNLQDR